MSKAVKLFPLYCPLFLLEVDYGALSRIKGILLPYIQLHLEHGHKIVLPAFKPLVDARMEPTTTTEVI